MAKVVIETAETVTVETMGRRIAEMMAKYKVKRQDTLDMFLLVVREL